MWMLEVIRRTIDADPDIYLPIFRKLAELDHANPLDNKPFQDLSPNGKGWEYGVDYAIDGGRLQNLIGKGILGKFGSNRSKFYTLLVPVEMVEEVLKEIHDRDQITLDQYEDVEIPDNLFDVIVGYDNIKRLFRLSLNSDKPVHIALIGEPATGKTVFLQEIARLKGAQYALGVTASKAGLRELLMDERPRYLLIDEIDKMHHKDYAVLLSLMETGIVSNIKANKREETVLNCRVYVCGNKDSRMLPELKSRFGQFMLYLKSYSKDQFKEVVYRVLTMREGVNNDLARYIADKLANRSKDPRDAISIARLAKNEADVDALIGTADEYTKRRY